MLIDVIADESTAVQVRTYAEYRFFAVLARHARHIRSVHVVLGGTGRHAGDGVTCTVDAVMEASENVHVRATRPNASGAIDHAAERLEILVTRRSSQTLSS